MRGMRWILFITFLLLAAESFAQVDTAWVRLYNGPANSEDEARALAVDDSGNVYVTGRSFYSEAGFVCVTIKYAPNGDTVWFRRGDSVYFVYDMALDASGNMYVTGSGFGSTDYATIKYAPNGDTLWVRRYNGPGNDLDFAYALAVDTSGNVYVTGTSVGTVWPDYDYATIKYAPNGDTLWVRRYKGPGNGGDAAGALAVDDNGNVYVTGSITDSGNDYDYATIKYAPNGDTLWIRRYNGPGNDYDSPATLALDTSGNVYVTGSSLGSGTASDYATIKYAPNGDTLWVRRYNGSGNDRDGAYALAVDISGNVYVTGESVGSGTFNDYATIKYAPNGDTLWVRHYNGPGMSADIGFALALDDSDNLFVTGSSNSLGSGTGFDYATVEYASNGDILWVSRYNGPGNADDHPNALAVDASGNVYVTGITGGSGISADYATIKYSPLPQLKGDLNLDGVLNPFDVVLSLNCTFLGEAPPAAPAACDINCDGKITPADVVVLLLMVFAAEPAPC